MYLHFLALISATAALELPDLGFGWQQVLSNLGLQDNNVTSGGCEAAVCVKINRLSQ
jgi:hypothetical protein